jgi:predicted MFS family arabinose efflux permease
MAFSFLTGKIIDGLGSSVKMVDWVLLVFGVLWGRTKPRVQMAEEL